MRWVRPILMIESKASAFCASVLWSVSTAGMSFFVICSPAAMCIAVGKVSFEDCALFTSSLGWIGSLEPISPPASSMARLAMTSFAFMFVCVPLPVCQTTSGKCASRSPAITSSAA